MARQPSFNPIKEWQNFHQSYEQVIEGEYDVFMPQQSAPLSVADMQETTRQFQALIAEARKQGLKARAIGSSWSLSRAPTTSGLVAQHQPAARPAEGRRPRTSTPPIPAPPTRRPASISFSAATPSPT